MPHLVLDGVSLDATDLTRLAPEVIGEEARAHSGADMSSVRARKSGWRVRLAPQLQATAQAIRALVQGEGHSWSFDSDLYSDRKGLGPSAGTGTVTASGKYSSYLALTAAAGLTYGVGAGSAWTLAGWKRTNDGAGSGAWHHFIRLSSGAKYKDGATTTEETGITVSGSNLVITPAHNVAGVAAWAPNGYAPGSFVAESGMLFQTFDTIPNHGDPGVKPNFAAVTAPLQEAEEDVGALHGGPWLWVNVGDYQYDDLLYLPALVPSDWPAQLYAEANARAWTPLPRLRLAGDVAAQLSGAAATVTGRVADVPTHMGVLSAAFQTTLEPLEFELREA